MKTAGLFVAACVLVFAGSTSAQGDGSNRFAISGQIHAQYNFWDQEDFNTSQETFRMQAEAFPDYDVMHPSDLGAFGGLGGRLRFDYQLKNDQRIGLVTGFDCFCEKEIEQGWTYNVDTRYTASDKLTLKIRSIPVYARYQRPCPVFDRVDLNAEAGVDIRMARLGYDFQNTWSDGSFWERGEMKDTGVTYHVGVGADYELWKGVKVGLSVGYDFGRLEDFTGTLESSEGQSREALWTMQMIETGYIFGHRYLDDPTIDDADRAGVDFSGFKISAGISYEFIRLGY